ncbi:inorganic pyrophosphatase [Pustulibacterium marinum]|uniref:inorganic diphosphatase n=1 Tax=Pustulibacterium marinum TaxID=1224947 RepID=A0A1I7F848_9FLAO|nr:inorganic diphosphatase [Pustulibacterium marinum]SFU32357.1 inorganic pyrophosphatase [Pustulibacterium marinum]
MKKLAIAFLGTFSVIFSSCSSSNYQNTSTFSEDNNLNAVVEIPAGTNKKIEYQEISKEFKTDQRNGEDRIIEFLPYVGNYGFIAGTLTKRAEDGDGDPVDVLILSEHQKTGKIVSVKPIALLKLVDNGDLDYKVIAIPSDGKSAVIDINSYQELQKEYPGIISIVETWFTNYDKVQTQNIVGWGDEKEALAYVNANIKNK